MNEFLSDLHTYITNSIAELATSKLFIGDLPVDIEDCVSVVSTASPMPSTSIGYFELNVDFWARSIRDEVGSGYLQSIFDLFHRARAYTVGDYYIYLSASNGLIEDFDKDAEGRKLYRLGMRFIYRDN